MRQSDYPAKSRHIEGLIALGRKSAKRAFPNPNREGCPGRARLREMAQTDLSLSLGDLPISHVVTCSPCFREFRRYRRIATFVRDVERTAPYAVAFALIILSALAFLQYGGRGILERDKHSQAQSGISTHLDSSASLRLPVTIDLAAFSPTRGTETDAAQMIHLAPRLLRMTIRLPIGLEPGEYAMQIKDAAGVVYSDTHLTGRVVEGSTSLNVDLDLSGVSVGNGALMIRPPGLSWRTFPVVFR